MPDEQYARGPGHRGSGTTEVWADCLHVACPACKQPAGEKCVNRYTEKVSFKAIPCWQRQRAAEGHS